MSAFSDIFGQDQAVETLLTAYRSGRLPHAMIFAGPVGVGKATTARALAKLFLCEKPGEDAPCGKCESCRVMKADTHPDYHLIRRQLIRLIPDKIEHKARDLAIDVIRAFLIEPASRTSVQGVGKVFVIEQADYMNAAAQNSLLKTLEEPQGRTLLILLTDQPGGLLSTIRSRCQMIRFSPLDAALVIEQLRKRGVNPAQAEKAARLAEGSLGVALEWIGDGVVDLASELTEKLDGMLEGKTWPKMQEWFKKAAEAYADQQISRDEKGSRDQYTREGLCVYFGIAAEHMRRKLPHTEDPELLERLVQAIDGCHEAVRNVESNVNVALALQQLSVSTDATLVRA